MQNLFNPLPIMKASLIQTTDSVAVTTTARLHMGFFDLNGGLGRQFGSIGLSLDQPQLALHAKRGDSFSAAGPGAENALKVARKLALALALPEGLGMHVTLQHSIAEHAGLGSGTQMALAVGLALDRLHGLGLSLHDVAKLSARGARSGIGVGTFAHGGLVVDGGRGPETIVPPVIARADFPQDWPILLISDRSANGVHGESERAAFRNLPEFSAHTSSDLCRRVLMQALPALAERDLQTFGTAIRELQHRTGDHFAPAQGGRYASQHVAKVLHVLESQGVACYGQSSWGPTGFAIFEDEVQARDALGQLEAMFSQSGNLQFMLCKARNQGAVVADNTSCNFDQPEKS